jgi:hypothetical protein
MKPRQTKCRRSYEGATSIYSIYLPTKSTESTQSGHEQLFRCDAKHSSHGTVCTCVAGHDVMEEDVQDG